MSTTSERISQLISALGLKQSSFCEKTGLGISTVNQIIQKNRSPRSEVIESILKTFTNVNPDWLLLNNGEIFREPLSYKEGIKEENTDFLEIDFSNEDEAKIAYRTLLIELENSRNTVLKQKEIIEDYRKLLKKANRII